MLIKNLNDFINRRFRIEILEDGLHRVDKQVDIQFLARGPHRCCLVRPQPIVLDEFLGVRGGQTGIALIAVDAEEIVAGLVVVDDDLIHVR